MKKAYEIVICILALVSVVLVCLDLGQVLSLSASPFKWIDSGILLIFTLDYAMRFFKSNDKKAFFKSNIFDLIAILPFNSILSFFRAFRIFRVLRLTKLAKLSRLLRAGAFLGVFRSKLRSILHTNGLNYVINANIALICVSAVAMHFVEDMALSDALWWSIVTCTTVGYGDLSPTTGIGRVIAVLLMLFGISLVSMLTGAITTYFTKNQKSEDNSRNLEEIIKNLDESEKEKVLKFIEIIKE